MKCCMTILALILLLQVIYTDSFPECPKDHFIIIDKNGNKIDCVLCARCVVGWGLRPQCGTKLTEAQRANIECLPCEPGKTYSDQHGPSSCKSCQNCPVLTLKKCTAESNTQCTKDCRRGFYYDNSTDNCQPCSYCCRKDNLRIAECADLPAQSQCSVHDAVECSPKTTKNPTSANHGSSGDDDKALITALIAIAVVVGVLVAGVIVVFLVWLILRHRNQRHYDQTEFQIPLRNKNNNCGLSESSFFIMVHPPEEHEVQEGKVLSLICENQGNAQDDNCFDNCNFMYDWKKDIMDLSDCHRKKIEFNPSVQVRDFGKYTCQVTCSQHQNQNPAEAIFDLDIVPEPPRRYKKFRDIKSLEVYENVADMLKSPGAGIGDWKRVAEKYGMAPLKINALQDNVFRGMEVIEFIKACHINLTVYHFCKFMKYIKQNQIMDLLENHLIYEGQGERQVDSRDIGYCPDFKGARSSSLLNVPGEGQNNPGLKDSRQGSRDQLAGTSQNELKLFTDLDWHIQMKIANSLKPKTVGIGNWMDLGIKFGIEKDALKALDKDKAPSEVLENIKCNHPELTVLEFCEIMKSMKQNKIVISLKDQLTIKPKEPTRSGINASNRPDSGYIAEELDSDGPLRVDLPPNKSLVSSKPSQLRIPALVNLGHVDYIREASREDSVEDLRSSLLNNVQNSKPMEDKVSKKLKSRLLRRKKSWDFQNVSDENNDFKDEDQDEKSDMGKKSRYGRQTSKDSQKSDDIEDFGTRERKRSRSSSITSIIKEKLQKTPSVESDEGALS